MCEEAGCPNIFDCWADGTATFMFNGERCTRACGFCLVDTRRPLAPDPAEPDHVAEAVARMGLRFVVLTAVARDDLADGGAAGFAATIDAIRAPPTRSVGIEVLIPDCKGDPDALDVIFDARPDVLNHNLETVARLQRTVRPSASYARSLAVLARARAAGLTTKSGLMVGLGESADELEGALADLHGVGVASVTIGQYLRPTARHLPVARWWTPDEIGRLKDGRRGVSASRTSRRRRSPGRATTPRIFCLQIFCHNRRHDRRATAQPDDRRRGVEHRPGRGLPDDATLAELDKAFMDHKVLFFRDQHITTDQHVAFCRRFGELEVHPFVPSKPGYPEVDGAHAQREAPGHREHLAQRRHLATGAVARARCCGPSRCRTSAATRCSPTWRRPTTRWARR